MDPLPSALRALADPTRCKILELLREGGRSVKELAEHFSMSRPAVSKHLSILREAELVASRRQGRQQIYDLNAAPLGPVREWLAGFEADESPAPAERPPRAAKRKRRTSRAAQRAPRVTRQDDWRCW